jgi:hypothetical protein
VVIPLIAHQKRVLNRSDKWGISLENEAPEKAVKINLSL